MSYIMGRRGTIEDYTWAWGIVSALLMTIGYAIYVQALLSNDILPNATSWSLWALGGIIEAWSFEKVVDQTDEERRRKQPFKYSVWVCAAFAILVAFLCTISGKWSIPNRWELYVAGFDLSIVAIYFLIKWRTGEGSRAAHIANILMVVDIAVSFFPIWVSTWNTPEKEMIMPWLIWACSYTLLGCMGLMQIKEKWKERRWLLIYPFTSAFFHGVVGVIVWIR